ncbi:MAG: phasin family protein [Planctomycetota bacterium]
MTDIINKIVNLGLGIASISKDKVESVVNDLVERGKLTQQEGSQVVDELVAKGEAARGEMRQSVESTVKSILESLDMPTRAEVDALKARIEKLEAASGTPGM